MEEKILIFGHKNPDTDTICSSIVKEILDKNGGRIDIKSVVGKGTEVVITIPTVNEKE